MDEQSVLDIADKTYKIVIDLPMLLQALSYVGVYYLGRWRMKRNIIKPGSTF